MANSMLVTLLLCFFARQFIKHVSSHDQLQAVSNTAFFFGHYFIIPWPTVCKSYEVFQQSFLCLSSYDQQSVSDIPSLSVISLHMANRLWVRKHLFFMMIIPYQYIISCWPTASVWYTILWSHWSYGMSNRKWGEFHSMSKAIHQISSLGQ